MPDQFLTKYSSQMSKYGLRTTFMAVVINSTLLTLAGFLNFDQIWTFATAGVALALALVFAILAKPKTPQVIANLQLFVSQLRGGLRTLENLGHEFEQTYESVNKKNDKAFLAVQNLHGSMEIMRDMVKTNIATYLEITKSISAKSDEGHKVIHDMTSAMNTLANTSNQLQNISGIFSKISSEANVINDIVFKTQLLSFNAFLEAARAGQHGSGFAVVAEEVGNLADSSGKAAKEIRSLLVDSQSNVEDILGKTKTRITDAKSTNVRAQEIFSEIVQYVADHLRKITESSKSQEEGILEAIKLIDQMKQSRDKSATNDAKALSRKLLDGARGLQDRLDEMSLLLDNSLNNVKRLVPQNAKAPEVPSEQPLDKAG